LSVAVALLTLLLLAAVIAVVSRPLLGARDRKNMPTGSRLDRSAANDERDASTTGQSLGESMEADAPAREELEVAREAKYREIRDTELDYRTGKLSAEDFEAVNATLRAEALAILDRLKALEDASTSIA
jgi:hypothetical protein